MSWRLAKSLVTLRQQVDLEAPHRRKGDDGTIGDASHASRQSDHNPNAAGVVCALDLTHDPRPGGFNSYNFAELLRRKRDPRIKYVVSNRRIFSSTHAPWTWRKYSGNNPHDRHVHISVGRGTDGQATNPELYDDDKPWDLTIPPAPSPS